MCVCSRQTDKQTDTRAEKETERRKFTSLLRFAGHRDVWILSFDTCAYVRYASRLVGLVCNVDRSLFPYK